MRLLPSLLLAVLLGLSGCGALPEELEEPEDMDWVAYQPVEPEEPPAPEYPAAFSMAYYRDHSLDPIICGEGIEQDVASLLYEPLFQINGKFEPEPVLCESFEWDETGRICTLSLRGDVAFQDGTPLTAKDVVATLLRAKDSERYGYRLRQVVSVATNRAGQVVITLTRPNLGFLSLLDIPIVKSGTEQQMVPMGTGPYLYVSGSGEDYLLANEDWWQHKALPIASIPLAHAKDRDTAMYLLSSRRVELLTVDPTDDLSSVTGHTETTNRPTAIMQFIGFNASSGVFSDAAVRTAFSRGVPRGAMAEARLAGLALDAQFPISPLSSLYPKDLERSYSRDDALSALVGAGQNTGEIKELTLLVNEEDSFRLTSAQYIAENLSRMDWRITVRALPWEEYMAALEGGDFDLYFGEVRLTADWDISDLIGTRGTLNYGGYSDAETDALLDQFGAEADRTAAVRELALHLQNVTPIVPLCFKNYTVLTYPDVVEGMSPAPSNTFYRMEDWTVHLSQ